MRPLATLSCLALLVMALAPAARGQTKAENRRRFRQLKERMVRGTAEERRAAIRELLLSSQSPWVEAVGRYVQTSRYPASQRLLAVRHLGSFVRTAPCLTARIPALLKALSDARLAAEAARALERLVPVRRPSPAAWKAWWKTFGGDGNDTAVLRDSLCREPLSVVEAYLSRRAGAGFQWALPALHQCLTRTNDAQRLDGLLWALGKVGHAGSVEPVQALVKRDRLRFRHRAEAVQVRAIDTLGRVAPPGDKEAGRALTGLFHRTVESRIKAAVLLAMGRMKFAPGAQLLAGQLRSESETQACAAAEGLGLMGAVDGLDAMLRAAKQAPQRVLAALLRAFVSLSVATHRGVGVAETEALLALCRKSLSHESRPVWMEAVDLAKHLGRPILGAPLARLYGRVKTLPDRKHLLAVLASFPPVAAGPSFVDALGDRSGDRGFGSGQNELNEMALAYFRDAGHRGPWLLAPLKRLVADRNRKNRTRAVVLLGDDRVWGPGAAAVLADCLHGREPSNVATAAGRTLRTRGGKEAVPLLIAALSGMPGDNLGDLRVRDVLCSLAERSNAARSAPSSRLTGGPLKDAWTRWWKRVKERFRIL